MQRPDPSEYDSYYALYVDQAPEGNILELMESEVVKAGDFLRGLPADAGNHRYQPDKWSVKQVIGHVIDVERTFAYRAFCFARCDKTELHSFDQNDYMEYCNANDRSIADLATELEAIRRSHIALFKSFDGTMIARKGIASGFEFSVRSLPFIIVGHEIHHRKVIKERYLP